MAKVVGAFMLKLILIALSFATLLTTVMPALAADIRPFISGSGNYRGIVIEGRIETGDYDRFVKIVKENQAQVSGVYIFSSGGDFEEAMKIGRAIRALDLASQVPMRSSTGRPVCESDGFGPKPNNPSNCSAASAAFFIHIGATNRGGTFLAVHRPVFVGERFGHLTQSQAQAAYDALQERARAYMSDMGVPTHVQEDVLGTPSDKALLLDEKTIKTYFWGKPAYRHEWLRNKCSRMTNSERTRSEELSRRLLRPRNIAEKEFSTSEREEMRALSAKEDEELKCEIAISRQSRVEAYEQFFGSKPSDHSGHNFAWWSQVTKYLGKDFYELAAEERLDEDRLGKYSFLKRTATANLPYLSLSDMGSKFRTVGWINVVSSPNPSPEFIRMLVSTLEDSWGKASGNAIDEWRWDRRDYSARLKYERVSGSGPFIGLIIEAK